MAVTDTNALSPTMQVYWDRIFLSRLQANVVHGLWAQPIILPKGEGLTGKLTKYNALTEVTTPLGQGVNPTPEALSATVMDVTTDQYGKVVSLTDIVETQSHDPLIEECVKLNGENAGQSFETMSANVLHAGTNVRYAAGRANRASITAADKFSVAEAKKMRRSLLRNNVPGWDGFYICLIHPDVAHDLTDDPKFIETKKYAATMDLMTGEIGMSDGVRYVLANKCKVFTGAGAAGIDVYSTIMFGRSAYGGVSYEAPEVGGTDPVYGEDISSDMPAAENYRMPVQIYVKPKGSAGTADALNLVSTVGWKACHKTVIIDQVRLVRCESSAST